MSSGRLFRSECFSAVLYCETKVESLGFAVVLIALLAIDLMVNGFLFLFN